MFKRHGVLREMLWGSQGEAWASRHDQMCPMHVCSSPRVNGKAALNASLACDHVIAGQPVELLLGAHLGW